MKFTESFLFINITVSFMDQFFYCAKNVIKKVCE